MNFKTIRFEHKITFSDVYEVQKYALRASKKTYYLVIFIGIVMLLTLIPIFLKEHNPVDLFFILLGLSFIFYQYTFTWLISKNIFKNSRASYIAPYNYEVSSEGIRFGNSYSSFDFSWNLLKNYRDDKHRFIFYFLPNFCCGLSKMEISVEEQNAILKLVKEKMNKNKR